ncbi:TetR/AcrR family transcriptional regulator [Streptomyces sp. NPDC096032]|uniref:TetR/AcrR family transcriptional regulator n=1 Tax=Streptomyces sp. NPDC096032 TaxID=3366070 RepID=UPI0038111E7C
MEKGYAGTSVDDIAKLAAVSKQTVYKHFANKEKLFAEIVLATTDQLDAMIEPSADVPADAAPRTRTSTGSPAVSWAPSPSLRCCSCDG